MQLRKFVARDMREALAMIKQELGPDAMVISTRSLNQSLLAGPKIEVVVGIDDAVTKIANMSPEEKLTYNLQKNLAYLQTAQNEEEPPVKNVVTNPNEKTTPIVTTKPPALAKASGGSLATSVSNPKISYRWQEDIELHLNPLREEISLMKQSLFHPQKNLSHTDGVYHELIDLRKMLSDLSQQIQKNQRTSPSQQETATQVILDYLLSMDLLPELAKSWSERLTGVKSADFSTSLAKLIVDHTSISEDFFEHNPSRKIALIGPTGIGKTTTIAKIAAHMSLRKRLSVTLISLDSYRVGAYEQLLQYANLMVLPLLAANDTKSFSKAMDSFKDADLVLIDTAGRGPHGMESYRQLLSDLFHQHQVDTYLTLSASTRQTELKRIVQTFATLEPKGLIFTKIDEASQLSAIPNAYSLTRLPLMLWADGQRVPEDIQIPSHQNLLELIRHHLNQEQPCREDPHVHLGYESSSETYRHPLQSSTGHFYEEQGHDAA